MRSINEYLLSKKNSNSGDIDWFPFPNDIEKKSVVKFLEMNDFERAEQIPDDIHEMYDYFDSIGYKSYLMQEYRDGESYWVRFFDGNMLCDSNPIFFIRIDKRRRPALHIFGTQTKTDDNLKYTKEDFIEKVNKHFGPDAK